VRRLVLNASAKVNLTLEVLGKRPDGYHEIATVMQAVDLSDQVVLEDARSLALETEAAGVPAGGDNLAMRAAMLLREAAGVDRGARIQTAPVRGWYDCGKPETLLETNRHLLVTGRGRMPAATPGVSIEGPVRVEDDVVLEESAIGPNVTIERGTRVSRSRLRNCIIGPEAVLEEVDLRDSLVGGRAVVRSFSGRLNVADDSEVVG